MKKLILPMFACFLAFSSISNATSKDFKITKPTTEIIAVYDVSAFCKLIKLGKFEAVKALIESGENVNKKSNGLTPLMFAARYNKAKIAKLLIENGARIKTKSDKGRMTALQMAKRSKAVDAIKVIKEAL